MLNKLTAYVCLAAFMAVAVSAQTAQTYYGSGITVENGVNNCGSDTGSGNAYTCSFPTADSVKAYQAGTSYTFTATHTNTGAATFQLGSLSALTIKKQQGTADVVAGDIVSGSPITVAYNGTYAVMQTPPATVTAGASGFGTSISSAAPMYLFAHFRDDDQSLYLDYSYDGTHFKNVSTFGLAGSGTIRDPSAAYINGTYYFVATGGGNAAGFYYWTSTDLRTFTSPQVVTLSSLPGGTTGTWSPEFFQDSNGSWYVVVTNQVSTTMHFYAAPWTPSNGAAGFGTPQAITLSGTLSTHLFDPQISFSGGTYRLIFADADSSWPGLGYTQYISVATSSSLLGPYTVMSSIQSNRNLLGFGTSAEGPTTFTLPNGCTRIIADTFVETTSLPYNSDSSQYTQKYTDTCDSFSTFSAVQTLPIAKSEQGTVITLTQPSQATTVLSATLANGGNVVPSHFGVNVLNPKYTLEIGSNAATGGLQWDESASFAANPGDGNDAIWSACSLSAAKYCPNPPASTGTWLTNSNVGFQKWGQVQINNPTNGVAGILLSDQATVFGPDPQGPSVWHLAENSEWFHDGSVNSSGVTGNHYLGFVWANNSGGVKSPLFLRPDTGEAHAKYALTLGNGQVNGNDAMDVRNFANIDAPSANVVNIGNGTIGDHSATVNTGTINASTATVSTLNVTTCNGCGSGGSTNVPFAQGQTASAKCEISDSIQLGTTMTIPANTLAVGDTVEISSIVQTSSTVNTGSGNQYIQFQFGTNGLYPSTNVASFQLPNGTSFTQQTAKYYVTSSNTEVGTGSRICLSCNPPSSLSGTSYPVPIMRWSGPDSASGGPASELHNGQEAVSGSIPVLVYLRGCSVGGSGLVTATTNVRVIK